MNQVIKNFATLENILNNFVNDSNKQDIELCVYSGLRRNIRNLKQKFSSLYYFAYGIGMEYKFYVSKVIFKIKFDELSHKTKKMFTAHSGIRIDAKNIADNVIDKIRPYTEIDNWLELLNAVLLFWGGEKEYISKHYTLENRIADDIINSSKYSSWKNQKFPMIESPYLKCSRKEIDTMNKTNNGSHLYNLDNDKSFFLAIDLKCANFQILRQEGFTKEKSWKDFLNNYVEIDFENPLTSIVEMNAIEYLSKSKLLRFKSVSRYDLNEHCTLSGNVILMILDSLIQNGIMTQDSFVAFNGDEIVFKMNENDMFEHREKCISFLNENHSNYQMHVELFQLFKLNTSGQNHYVKVDKITGKVLFKGVCEDEFLFLIDIWEKQMNELV